ncbi:ABC transporter substrate-binding protein [Spirochaetia bacterium]|nr:ABC transporter substrate-binding protein [Spirochaetia bacterium]
MICFRYRIFFGAVLLLIILLIVSCFRSNAAQKSDSNFAADKPFAAKPLIAASILPQSWFIERIGGERVRTMVLVGPGQNPHNYEPTPKQMAALAEAQVWLLSGAEFEIGLRPKIESLFPRLIIVDGTAGVNFRSLEEHEDDEHEHSGAAGLTGDDDSNIDRHTWLGSEPAKIMAAHIRSALSRIDEEGASLYGTHYAALVRDIDTEFGRLRGELAPLRGSVVFVYHPSFGYFLDEFGIVQKAIETGGKEPGPRDLVYIMEEARREGAAAIFVQAQFPVQAAETAAASIGAELVALDPLAPDWLANVRIMGEALKQAAAAKSR